MLQTSDTAPLRRYFACTRCQHFHHAGDFAWGTDRICMTCATGVTCTSLEDEPARLLRLFDGGTSIQQICWRWGVPRAYLRALLEHNERVVRRGPRKKAVSPQPKAQKFQPSPLSAIGATLAAYRLGRAEQDREGHLDDNVVEFADGVRWDERGLFVNGRRLRLEDLD